MKFRPLHDRVVVTRIEEEAKTAGGIIIPDTAKEKPQQGEVIAVGPGARDEAGKINPIDVKVGDRVLFDYDSSVLNPVATQTLDRQAAWLKQYLDVIVTVEGHSDERGTREYNLAIGDGRATAVRNYLLALGVESNRILTISYGEERPADAGSDETAWANNRRAVTVLTTVN